MRLRALAPGKINLCLFLGGIRADGRHELVTLLESVSLADVVELTPRARGRDEVSCHGVEGPNIVSRTLEGLRRGGWNAPPVRVEIRKQVPVAGGMGGGSADAAAVLRLAQELEPVSAHLLAELAAQLGADVPSQLAPGAVLGTGAGDVVEPIEPLAPHALMILPMPVPLATADVFREADRLGLPREAGNLAARRQELAAAIGSGIELPSSLLVNDLEPAALSLRPEIQDGLDAARELGAAGSMVCGSGPTVAGLYWGAHARKRAEAGAAALARRFAGASCAFPVTAALAAPQHIPAFGHNSDHHP